MPNRFCLTTALVPLLAIAACSDGANDGQGGEPDPATEQALNDQIMVDPDLANQNEGNAALTGGTDQSIPPENMTPAAIQDARDQAFALVGGSDGLKDLPEAQNVEGNRTEAEMLTATTRAAAFAGNTNCVENAKYSASWAANLPTVFPVYPRGSTKEAAGTNMGGCSLRTVTFLSPVPLEEVLAFYFSRATTAGYSTQHVVQDGDNVLSGTKGKASYVIYGRQLPSGLTEVDLITSGH
ncbi:hypothetical protein [Pontixanthobacter aquaemixtae]|uniref:Lipoprotein n=1 Tax=Pontixanthobacter aquaemixtae TaxID=1958940 RepID=A0A844ZW67_9SPHN|nr:hypothetical protein [Pontixanthobacter aquaemixtae]MXO89749.1 hypothetical protein [Pontixanthobacter aquaemixtae]